MNNLPYDEHISTKHAILRCTPENILTTAKIYFSNSEKDVEKISFGLEKYLEKKYHPYNIEMHGIDLPREKAILEIWKESFTDMRNIFLHEQFPRAYKLLIADQFEDFDKSWLSGAIKFDSSMFTKRGEEIHLFEKNKLETIEEGNTFHSITYNQFNRILRLPVMSTHSKHSFLDLALSSSKLLDKQKDKLKKIKITDLEEEIVKRSLTKAGAIAGDRIDYRIIATYFLFLIRFNKSLNDCPEDKRFPDYRTGIISPVLDFCTLHFNPRLTKEKLTDQIKHLGNFIDDQ